jgi:hypothetical protein
MKTLLIRIAFTAAFFWLPVTAKAQAVYYASEELSFFGYLDQRDPQITSVLGANGCNPTSWVNAFYYLQNVNPGYLGNLLVGTSYQDWINADITVSGPRYLNTSSTNGTTSSAIIPGLQNYFNDLGLSGLNVTSQQFPTWNHLYNVLVSSTATQLLLAPFGEGIGHAVSLVAINWNTLDSSQNRVSFIDPQNPTNGSNPGAALSSAYFVNYTEGSNTVIAFNYPGSTNGYYIQSSYTVSVPEPSTHALLGIGAIGMLIVLRWKRAA